MGDFKERAGREVSAADPDRSPLQCGQTGEGGGRICLLLLEFESITDLWLSPRSEKIPNKKPAWSSCFPWPPADHREGAGDEAR